MTHDPSPGTALARAIHSELPGELPSRITIEGVKPEIDAGRFPVKRVVGEEVEVTADIHADGHDVLCAIVRYRHAGARDWRESTMEPLVNDRWRGGFKVAELGRYQYTITAWVDPFLTWRRQLEKKHEAGQDVALELLAGTELIAAASARAGTSDAARIREWAERVKSGSQRPDGAELALAPELMHLLSAFPDRRHAASYERVLEVVVDPERARVGAWYEMFPRSTPLGIDRHGTFADVTAQLPLVAEMGFDILYLPPIHPIGRTLRKGRNNTPVAGPDDVGSPWAIGGPEGGHKAVHPALGTLANFRELVTAARDRGIEIALDFALQCSPDHPYVKEHPEWFRHRPDGSIQYAENPPKKYEDIYPLDFECERWRELWVELASIVFFWIEQGVRVFRVDNPHTKPYAFWEWLISTVKERHPEIIFLSEAFTRPKVMYRLAKLGFSQSYTYYAWRNTSWEIREYLTELTRSEVSEYFRPNLWPNTPDILTEYLQAGGQAAFLARVVLAATLGASYGIYGPAYELLENTPLEPGREEYLNSEKYEIRRWDLDHPESLRHLIGRINHIRRENVALHSNRNLRFHPIDNDQLIAYSKSSDDLSSVILTVVNLDPHHTHSGWLELPIEDLAITERHPYQVHDLLSEARYLWHGPRNYVEINPHVMPAQIFKLRRRLRTERDFDYYM